KGYGSDTPLSGGGGCVRRYGDRYHRRLMPSADQSLYGPPPEARRRAARGGASLADCSTIACYTPFRPLPKPVGEIKMPDLPKRQLGRTGLQVTALGFGAMELRDAPRGRPVDSKQAGEVLNAVL